MKFERDGTGSLRDLISPGWSPSRAINLKEEGAPEVPVTVPSPMEQNIDHGAVPEPQLVAATPPQPAAPIFGPPPSGVMVDTGQAAMFGEVFALTPEERRDVAATLAKAYERVQRDRVAAFRNLHQVPAVEQQQLPEVRALPDSVQETKEAAGSLPKVRKTRKIRDIKVRQVHSSEAGSSPTTPDTRPGISHLDIKPGSVFFFNRCSDGVLTPLSTENWGVSDGGQEGPIAGLHSWQLSANGEEPQHGETKPTNGPTGGH